MNKIDKISYRENGYIVEFKKHNKEFWIYSFKKILSFLTDVSFYTIFLLSIKMLINISWINSLIISYFLFFIYCLGVISLFKNKTLGMLLAGLEIGQYDGNKINLADRIKRSALTSLYAFPIINIVIIISNLFTNILNNGLNLIDVFTKTQIFTKWFYKKTIRIMKEINK